MVWLKPSSRSSAPASTLWAESALSVSVAPAASTPASTVVLPVWLLAPDSVSVPVPTLDSEPPARSGKGRPIPIATSVICGE